ncbi:hypothetical protein DUNSADRAFT_15327 [Dunaliella salina]|uniref:Encoded protein n=1 Tax=Dunaliella salina TaxID=3046 RepID=A0ABQ7G5L2_DUNSA|nr:hypothetical protein DUNSADRAFT_15327 [Dunaliella salina]|eukprot:KAF5829904.1 hypothetical protein DUNSADRAFT_15327 [Dunaliella salina]
MNRHTVLFQDPQVFDSLQRQPPTPVSNTRVRVHKLAFQRFECVPELPQLVVFAACCRLQFGQSCTSRALVFGVSPCLCTQPYQLLILLHQLHTRAKACRECALH